MRCPRGAHPLETFSVEALELEHCPKCPAGVSFMVENGTIVRVDVDSAGVLTTQCIRVGVPVAQVEAGFRGQLQVQPHPYLWEQGWNQLIAYSTDSSHAILFETDSQYVRRYRAGLWPQVGYKERCG